MSTAKVDRWVFALYALAIGVSVICIHPGLFRRPGTALKQYTAPPRPLPFAGDMAASEPTELTPPAPPSLSQNLTMAWLENEKIDSVALGELATPAVDASGIYVGSATGWFYAFDLNGKRRWVFYAGEGNAIRDPAQLDEKYVYVSTRGGFLNALDKASGALLWSLKLGREIDSAVLSGNSILAAVSDKGGGSIARVRRVNGDVVWQSDFIEGNPGPIFSLGGRAYYAVTDRLVAIAADSGQLLWSKRFEGQNIRAFAVDSERIYLSCRPGRICALDHDGNSVWQQATDGSPSLSLASHRLIEVGPGARVAVRKPESGELVWHFENPTWKTFGEPIVAAASNSDWLWLSCGFSTVCALNLQKQRTARTYSVPDRISHRVTAFGHSLFVTFRNGLLRFDQLEKLKAAKSAPDRPPDLTTDKGID